MQSETKRRAPGQEDAPLQKQSQDQSNASTDNGQAKTVKQQTYEKWLEFDRFEPCFDIQEAYQNHTRQKISKNLDYLTECVDDLDLNVLVAAIEILQAAHGDRMPDGFLQPGDLLKAMFMVLGAGKPAEAITSKGAE